MTARAGLRTQSSISFTCWGQITALETTQGWFCQEMQVAWRSERNIARGFLMRRATLGGLPPTPSPFRLRSTHSRQAYYYPHFTDEGTVSARPAIPSMSQNQQVMRDSIYTKVRPQKSTLLTTATPEKTQSLRRCPSYQNKWRSGALFPNTQTIESVCGLEPDSV